MSLTLNDDECATLAQALDYYLPQLRMQRAGAEARDAQHALSVLETKLDELRRRLSTASSAATEWPADRWP
jgi:type II secretory pathway pseudopilin PulG